MVNNKVDWFTKCNYWRNWSRTFVRGGGQGYDKTVEVSITPINRDDPQEWRDLLLLPIRIHLTNSHKDHWTHNLDDQVRTDLIRNMGDVFTDFLLNYDIHAKICKDDARFNMGLFQKHVPCGGGIPLVILDPKFDELKRYWKENNGGRFKVYKDWLQSQLNLDKAAVDNLDIYDRLMELEAASLTERPPANPIYWKGCNG